MKNDNARRILTAAGFIALLLAVFASIQMQGITEIMHLQFAHSRSEFASVKNSIDTEKYINANYWDYLFIASYTALIYIILKLELLKMNLKGGRILLLITIPGVADVIENVMMNYYIMHTSPMRSFPLYYFIVRLKWYCSVPLIIIGVTTLLILLFSKRRSAEGEQVQFVSSYQN